MRQVLRPIDILIPHGKFVSIIDNIILGLEIKGVPKREARKQEDMLETDFRDLKQHLMGGMSDEKRSV